MSKEQSDISPEEKKNFRINREAFKKNKEKQDINKSESNLKEIEIDIQKPQANQDVNKTGFSSKEIESGTPKYQGDKPYIPDENPDTIYAREKWKDHMREKSGRTQGQSQSQKI